jgi:uncharacterized membrane protein
MTDYPYALWGSFVFVGIAGIFGYHIWLGWRTGIVRLPLSVLVFQEFEREDNPQNFWGIMTLDAIGLIAAIAAAVFFAGKGL